MATPLFVPAILVALVPLAWLISHHALPWLTAQQEFLALLGVLLAAVGVGGLRCPPRWVLALALAAACVLVHLVAGRMPFAGDAWMAWLYLGALAVALAVGQRFGQVAAAGHPSALVLVVAAVVACAALSVAVAWMQWLDRHPPWLAVKPLLAGDRPYGQLAQPNHFSTVAFLGLAGAMALRDRAVIGAPVLGLLVLWFCAGLAMSGSRTAWLQLAVVVAMAALGPAPDRARWLRWAVFAVVAYAAFAALWPALNTMAATTADRPLADQLRPGLRWPLWQAMFDASLREPVWGHGWGQGASALVAVAPEHASLQRFLDRSHNLVLDLVVWNGWPLGLLLTAALLWALLPLHRAARAAPGARWLAAGALGLLAHAMVEYPLEYAFFLVPLGLMVGMAQGLGGSPAREGGAGPGLQALRGGATRRGRPTDARALAAALLVLLGLVARDQLVAEQNYRDFRTERQFGVQGALSTPPDLWVLTQLEAFLNFVRQQAEPGMSPEAVQRMRTTVTRYPHPPALLRLALAEGLNGQPEAAARTLRVLCAMHEPVRCREGRSSWQGLQARYPVLAAVPYPGE